MMNKLLKIAVLLLYTFTWVSCSDDETNYKKASWTQDVKISGKLGTNKFKVNINEITGISGWASENVDVNLDLDWGTQPENPITQVDLYINVQEKLEDGTTNMVGGTSGKLIRTVTTFDAAGKFSISLTANEIYQLFEDDFTTTRTKLSHTDVFEMDWVITNANGETFDSRECFSEFCQFGFKPEVTLVDIWAGVFNYKYVQVGPGYPAYGVSLGKTGVMNLTKVSTGVFKFPDLIFYGYPYGSYEGRVLYNAATGGVKLQYVGSYAIYDNPIWQIMSINGAVLTIKWTYDYSAQYGEWGTVELTRTDGLDWPSNLYME